MGNSESILPRFSTLPIMPLRNAVLFPASVVPINVGRQRSVRLVEEVMSADRPVIGVVAQLKPEIDIPGFEDVYEVGTVARILKVIRLSADNYSVILQGVSRVRILEAHQTEPYMQAYVERISDAPVHDVEIDALTVHLREAARSELEQHPSLPEQIGDVLDNVQDPGGLADLVASYLPSSTASKQNVLECFDIRDRLRHVSDLIAHQTEVLRVKNEISTMVNEEMSKSQRELLLRQQLRTIRKELGEEDDTEDELEQLRDQLAETDLPKEVERAAKKQLSRLSSMARGGSEFHVTRGYVEWLLELPWKKSTPDRLDVSEVRRVLDEDHQGLTLVKKRVLEYIAVRKLRADKRGPLLCFAGPPGVGKTSLGRSIARATGRQFVRISLGGVQDEAEIRGHRRTYVGSMPGRIIAAIKKAGARNPVIMLDEIDKMATESRGSPSAALLEVLDPEQNNTFVDHYIEVPMDLSHVMFIATANQKHRIPAPLLDRMEVIDIPGYTRPEKLAIARDFLLPKQLAEHGLSPERLEMPEPALEYVVDHYTHEAGVRGLERQMAALCREVAVRLATGEDVFIEGDNTYVTEVLGPPKFNPQNARRTPLPGVATGLFRTAAGGDLLIVESSRMPGKGTVHLTGQMGDIMKESAAAAFTYIRARATQLGLESDFLTTIDVHVHLQEGGIAKDGPSAGLPIFVSLASMLTKAQVRTDVAMAGEITLRGNILRIGGIKDKCIAAHRAGIKRLVLPSRNEPELEDVPEHVRKEIDIQLVSRIDQVLPLVLN